ncbi:hypothetical protein, partial [Salinispora mooreana]|uniref:hypothetical protein n=1 Tax=Salinispora mooreana TaxID=999545 RepID=UPI001CC4ECD7
IRPPVAEPATHAARSGAGRIAAKGYEVADIQNVTGIAETIRRYGLSTVDTLPNSVRLISDHEQR